LEDEAHSLWQLVLAEFPAEVSRLLSSHAYLCRPCFRALDTLSRLKKDLSLKEKPKSEGWRAVEERRIPLLLNYAQCMLLMENYTEVIRHTTSVLEFDADNVKALYRRAKAHAACWDREEAEADFARVVKLDPSLRRTVEREVNQLRQKMKKEEEEEKARLQGKLF